MEMGIGVEGGFGDGMQDTIEYIPEHPGFHAGRVSPRAVHTYVHLCMATVAVLLKCWG